MFNQQYYIIESTEGLGTHIARLAHRDRRAERRVCLCGTVTEGRINLKCEEWPENLCQSCRDIILKIPIIKITR